MIVLIQKNIDSTLYARLETLLMTASILVCQYRQIFLPLYRQAEIEEDGIEPWFIMPRP